MPVVEYVHPDDFAWWGERARALGFESVASGPLVRSSFHADELAGTVKAGESFFVPPGVVHDGKNESGAMAKVLATYVVEKGKPLASPAQ